MLNLVRDNSIIINNYRIDFSDLMEYFSRYNDLYFFCSTGYRKAIQISADIKLSELSDYNPLNRNKTLMSELLNLIEIYQNEYINENTDKLMDYNYLEQLEIISDQIDSTIEFRMSEKLPLYKECEISNPRWIGNELVINLKIYES